MGSRRSGRVPDDSAVHFLLALNEHGDVALEDEAVIWVCWCGVGLHCDVLPARTAGGIGLAGGRYSSRMVAA